MTPEDIYNAVKDLTPYQIKKWYIDNNITEQQKRHIKILEMLNEF